MVVAILAGATWGGALTGAAAIAPSVFNGLPIDPLSPASTLLSAIFIALPAAFVWFWGLVCVGLPFWAALHGAGLGSRRAAVVLGAVLSFSVALQLGHDLGARHGTFLDQPPLIESVIGLIGAFVGAVVWRRAYTAPRGI